MAGMETQLKWHPVDGYGQPEAIEDEPPVRDVLEDEAFAWHFNFSADPNRDPIEEPTHRIVSIGGRRWRFERSDEFGSWLLLHAFEQGEDGRFDLSSDWSQGVAHLILQVARSRKPDFYARVR